MTGARVQRSLFLVVAVTAIASRSGRADVLIEEYDCERPGDAGALLAPMRDEVEKSGGFADPARILATYAGLPQPGITDPTLTLAKIRDDIYVGVNMNAHEQYESARDQFKRVLNEVYDNEALVVSDANAASWLTKAYLGLAVAYLGLKDRTEAVAAVEEQERSFPEHPITIADFGSEGDKLAQSARKQLDAEPRGNLLVVVADRPDAQVFVDEQGRGREGAFSGDLARASYRVLIQASGVSRRYRMHLWLTS